METVLADLDTDAGPLLSSAAAAGSQSDQAASKAGAPQLASADVGTTYVSLKSSEKVAIDRHPVLVSTILADFLRAYSEFVRQPFDALRIAHQSRAVERWQWRFSFSQLAWGTDVVLEVQAHQQPVADADAGPAQQPDVVSQGHAKQVGHCVQLKHGDSTWEVRKPNTIRLGEAIQEFMQHEAKASPDGRQYQALLADGSLVDTSLSIAALALTPEDTVEAVQPVPAAADKGSEKAAYADPGYSFKLWHQDMNPWLVKLPASASLSDALEAFLKAKSYHQIDDDECRVKLPNGKRYARGDKMLNTSIADLGLKPDSTVKVLLDLG
ncbi:hypothetical protein WJX82_010381 [Trebouxia sp. C0006]